LKASAESTAKTRGQHAPPDHLEQRVLDGLEGHAEAGEADADVERTLRVDEVDFLWLDGTPGSNISGLLLIGIFYGEEGVELAEVEPHPFGVLGIRPHRAGQRVRLQLIPVCSGAACT